MLLRNDEFEEVLSTLRRSDKGGELTYTDNGKLFLGGYGGQEEADHSLWIDVNGREMPVSRNGLYSTIATVSNYIGQSLEVLGKEAGGEMDIWLLRQKSDLFGHFHEGIIGHM